MMQSSDIKAMGAFPSFHLVRLGTSMSFYVLSSGWFMAFFDNCLFSG